ncbi:MAG TPA: dihydrofolate reductase family protein [Solirubrobacteraceae bacterium]|nr:dihydrofolate reductase family protein [Solirubrobacteraceae bacterium]
MFTSCYISTAIVEPPIALRRLLPPGESLTPEEFVRELALRGRRAAGGGRRPYVLVNMASTLDGRASVSGRSAPLSGPADRGLFHALRSVVDGVLVGAGTARAEGYGPIVTDPATRRARVAEGRSEQPLACIVSGRLDLSPTLALLADEDSRVAILTPSQASLAATAAHVEYVRREREGALDLPGALAELQDRLQVGLLLCEGGPRLNGQLFRAGLVDELFLSLAPTLAGEPPDGEPALRILAGAGAHFDSPLGVELASVLESDSQLFLRYRVCARGDS